MNNPTFIRVSGWAFVIGAFFFYISFFYIYMYMLAFLLKASLLLLLFLASLGIHGDNVGYLSFYASPILLTIGMFGLRARYGETVGKLGKTILLISPAGIPLSFFEPLRGAGLFVLMTCLTVFGVLALITKPLPRWRNGLPIIAGIGYPALFLAGVPDELLLFRFDSLLVDVPDELFIHRFILTNNLLAIQFTALMLLGFMLKRDVIDNSKPHLQEQTA